MNLIKPNKLQKGDTITIIAPAGNVNEDKINNSVKYFENLGYKVKLGNNIFKTDRYLAGSDEQRLKDLHNAFADKNVKAIICARGGYGCLRLINKIDYDLIKYNPKIFCGYSDITALSLMFLKQTGLITFSAPMPKGDFQPDDIDEFTANNFWGTINNDNLTITAQNLKTYKDGSANGIVWGQNNKETLAKNYYEKAQGSAANGYLQKAAELGYAPAQYDLAICYANGFGNQRNDYGTAVKWLKKAAKQGFTKAQVKLGFYYNNGYGVKQNAKEAASWFKKAAELGDAEAQNDLAFCFNYGIGVSQNYEKALYWYRKSAEQGYARAQYNLGVIYYEGDGVILDELEAVKWFRKAANQGFADAEHSLGVCYFYGNGVKKNEEKAREWFEKAAAQGHKNAQSVLNEYFY